MPGSHWPSRALIWAPAALLTLPLLWLFSAWTDIDADLWRHLADTQLSRLFGHSLVLLLGVGSGVTVIGVTSAWLNARLDFPGRRLFDWALFLPLAIPAYVLAFIYLGLLDYAGPVRTMARAMGVADPAWIDPRQWWAVCGIFTLALYPYVYLTARAAFLCQGSSHYEAARSLGCTPAAAFFKVCLPMARPAIAAGALLAVMEVLADFGAVSVLGYDTFTTAIYKTWFSLFSLNTAAQLACLLLLFMFVLVLAERQQRGRARYAATDQRTHRLRLRGWHAWAAVAFQSLVLLFAFLVPMAQLLFWALGAPEGLSSGAFLDAAGRSLTLAVLGSLIILLLVVPLALVVRRGAGRWQRFAVEWGNLGYALPGTVLAVALMLSLTRLDQGLHDLQSALGVAAPVVLSGTVVALLLAYLVRFLRVGFGPVQAGLDQIRPALEEAAASLGAGPGRRARELLLPLLRPGLMAALLLCSVEIIKEMPATLMLRPFGWDTLAVKIYELTSEGEWQLAAWPALTLVLAGLLPTIWLIRGGRQH